MSQALAGLAAGADNGGMDNSSPRLEDALPHSMIEWAGMAAVPSPKDVQEQAALSLERLAVRAQKARETPMDQGAKSLPPAKRAKP